MATVTSIIREDAALVAAEMQEELAAFADTTVLVTGAAGFLLSHLVDVFAAWNASAARPCRVLALDTYRTGLPERVRHLERAAGIRWIAHDVATPFTPDDPIAWIVHGASIASPTFYRRHPLETIDANVGGTRRLLDLARTQPLEGFLHLSSSEVYGDPAPEAVPTREDYPGRVSFTGPRACYDESKRLGETLCTLYHRLHAVPVRVVRPFNVYGPGQRLDDQRVVPDLMRAALAREPIVLLSDGRATRSFCYARDFIRGLLRVWVRGISGEAYNLGNDEEVSIAHTAGLVARLAGPPPLEVLHERSDDPDYVTDNPQRRRPDLAKVRALGWEPVVPLADGLARTLASYREEAAS
jgi:dTDP-glucose 4,6-dehydratase/UDP-glucuronate decarboxylase